MSEKRIRIIYAAGPGDVAGTFLHWKEGRDDPSQVSLTYSAQFFDVCKWAGADALVISHHGRVVDSCDGQFRIVQRPKWLRSRSGLTYHLSEMLHGLRVVVAAMRFRADLAVISDGTTHWFALTPLFLFGTRVIPAIHCVLWPKYKAPNRIWRMIWRMNRRFFRKIALAVMSASNDITAQVIEVSKGSPRPIVEFLPTYKREMFSGKVEPHDSRSTFHVLFAGRIERDMGEKAEPR